VCGLSLHGSRSVLLAPESQRFVGRGFLLRGGVHCESASAHTCKRHREKNNKIPRHEAQYPRQDHNEAVNTTHQVKSSSRHQVVNHRLDLPRYQQQSTINSKTKTTEQNRATKPSRRQRQRRFAVAVSRKSDLWFSDFRRPVLHSSSFRISGFSFFPDVHAQTLTQPSS